MRFYAEAYGCTLNRGEAGEAVRAWQDGGHTLVSDLARAEAILVATCVVIDSTERKVMRRLAMFTRLGIPLAVTGCAGSASRESVKEVAPDATIFEAGDIDGPKRWMSGISESVSSPAIRRNAYGSDIGGPRIASVAHVPFTREGDVVCPLPIATGCAGSCTYCITRLARGWLVSRPRGVVLESARAALAAGAAELQLCAQDAGAYGGDIGGTLPELVRAVGGLDGDFMVRVGMMNPASVKGFFVELLDAFESTKVYKFLHMPVQSGDDRILASMGRRHTAGECLEMMESFRERFPESTISTDVIVGFPGEGAKSHQATVDFLEAARPDIVNVTRFSPRPGTAAAGMGGIPHGRETKARSRELSPLRRRIAAKNNGSFVGRRMDVLTTERGKGGTTLARTQGYRQVVISGDLPLGKWYDVTIFRSTHINLFGKPA